ncbi:MAG: hypothetical protein U0T74_05785 [Chitinophagales bacterium]
MRIINAEEARSLTPILWGRTTQVSAAVANLDVGQTLEITRQDWKAKRPPYAVVKRVAKKYGRVFEKGRNQKGNGWWVKRIS